MNGSMRNLLHVVLILVCVLAHVQPVEAQPICDKYSGKALFIRNGAEITRSCEQLGLIVQRLSMQSTTFSQARETLKSSAGMNIHEAKLSDFPNWMKCNIERSPTKPAISCNLVMFQSRVVMLYQGSSSGFIDKLTITIDDATELVKPMIAGLDEKRDTKTLPLFTDFLLDVLVANNNLIAPNEETYRRTARGLAVSILNIYPR